MKDRDQGLTLKEFREKAGIPLQTKDFIPPRREGQRFYLPYPEVPVHLMEEDQVETVQSALVECIAITGSFGQRRSQVDTSEFQEAAKTFQEATGVKILDVFDLAYSLIEGP